MTLAESIRRMKRIKELAIKIDALRREIRRLEQEREALFDLIIREKKEIHNG